MKLTNKNILSSILIMFMTILFCSCEKMPMNGDLEGMWQLMKVNGETPQRRSYISFQMTLVQLTYGDDTKEFYFSHFKHEKGTMRFFDFCYPCGHENWDQDNVLLAPEDSDKIKPFGMYALDITYEIEKLNRNRMVLKNDTLRLEYRKF